MIGYVLLVLWCRELSWCCIVEEDLKSRVRWLSGYLILLFDDVWAVRGCHGDGIHSYLLRLEVGFSGLVPRFLWLKLRFSNGVVKDSVYRGLCGLFPVRRQGTCIFREVFA